MKKKLIFTSLAFASLLGAKAQNSASWDQNSANSGFGISGQDCSAFGYDALINNANASYLNTATGYKAMEQHHYGDENTANGAYSLNNNGPSFSIRGYYNTAIGHSALFSNDEGDENTATGFESMYFNDRGFQNTANGVSALYNNIEGFNNTATGYFALKNNGSGAFGWTPEGNTASGAFALETNNDGSYNTGVGYDALKDNTYGTYNTAMGVRALKKNSYGTYNTSVGFEALRENVSGDQSTAVGYSALLNSTTIGGNDALGSLALSGMTSGRLNSGIGFNAGGLISSGEANVSVGSDANAVNTTQSYNVAVGARALNNGSGDFCTAVGYEALANTTTGNNCSGMGYISEVNGAYNNATAIGHGAIADANNKVRLGNAGILNVYSNGATVTTVSDGRFKYNLSETDVKGLDFILKLRPVIYNFDSKKHTEFLTKNMSEAARKKHLAQDFSKNAEARSNGFIAQEVEKAAAASGYDFSGLIKPENENGHYSLSYAKFVVPLVKAVQEQQQLILAQQQISQQLMKEMEVRKEATDQLLQNTKNVKPTLQEDAFEKGFEMNAQPNPFAHNTTVTYILPAEINSAVLAMYDLQGKEVNRYPLTKGSTSLLISSENLAAGIYIYSILADGKLMGSRSIVVTRK